MISCKQYDDSGSNLQGCDGGTFIGNVELRSQQDVIEFGAKAYIKIDGELKLMDESESDDKIVDLRPLYCLTEIVAETDLDNTAASLHIQTTALRSLAGLENLTNVGTLRLIDNRSLLTLDGLIGLTRIRNQNHGTNLLEIRKNLSLLNIDGLENLQTVGRINHNSKVIIIDNYMLQNINGLQGLSAIGSSESEDTYSSELFVISNEVLDNIDGLSRLMYLRQAHFVTINGGVAGDFIVFGNNNINSFCGIKNLLVDGYYEYFINDGSPNDNYSGFAPTVQDIINGNCAL